jgi:polar amino acid transport system substrate-binding protein
MIRQITLLAAFVFSMCYTLSSHAYLPYAQPVELVTGNQYGPFSDGRLHEGGMITHIVKGAYASVGRRVIPRFMPWRRAFIGVERGHYAGTFPHFYSEELAYDYYYSDPIYPIRQRIYVSPNRTLNIDSLKDLAGYRLCSPIGHVLDERLQKLIDTATISIISPASIQICAGMLLRERVDFIVLDETVYEYTTPSLNLKAVGKPLETSGLFLLFPKNSPDSLTLLWEFNMGLNYLRDCGAFDSIIEFHLQSGIR